MKKLFFLLMTFVVGNLTFGQSQLHEKVAGEIEKNYNSGEYGKIFLAFSPEMQTALPLETTNDVFSNVKAQFGQIMSLTFVDLQQGYASYKTNFERGALSMNLSVDSEGKIDGLQLQPFKEKVRNDVTVVNALTKLSDKEKAILFENTKMFPNKTQLAIAFIENGKPRFYGIIRENDTIKFIENKGSIFEIGSVSKVFTATLLANAVIEKKIKLDDKINSYYNFKFKDNIEIDFKSLANHTSGLDRLPSNLDLSTVDQSNPYKDYNEQKLKSYLETGLQLKQKSGGKYQYSNLGAGLLGYTLGLSQKSTYEKLLSDQIFSKYKMTHSFTDKNQIKTTFVKGLDPDGNEVPNWDLAALEAAGGILSTVSDLSKFVIAQFNPKNRELALTRTPTFTIDEKKKIGLGWHIIKTDSGNEIYWHNGGTSGYSSSVAMNTDLKNGVIILSNVSTFNPDMGNIDEICFELLKNLEK